MAETQDRQCSCSFFPSLLFPKHLAMVSRKTVPRNRLSYHFASAGYDFPNLDVYFGPVKLGTGWRIETPLAQATGFMLTVVLTCTVCC